jgi:hypothetical protein
VQTSFPISERNIIQSHSIPFPLAPIGISTTTQSLSLYLCKKTYIAANTPYQPNQLKKAKNKNKDNSGNLHIEESTLYKVAKRKQGNGTTIHASR